MTKLGFKRGFTLVELIIVVGILALLSGAAYIGIQRSQARLNNEKVLDDLAAISNALEQYRQDNGLYPIPSTGVDKNVSCFKDDTSYSHDCSAPAAAFIQAMVDNALLTKRYLQEVPTDPRTQSRYVYGVTTDGSFFQVAGNYQNDDGTWVAKVEGNVEKGFSLPSLIRAFDGPNFVLDSESYLPFSPDHLTITATLDSVSGAVDIDGTPASNGDVVEAGATVKTAVGASAVLYFSDGSVTHLDEDTRLRLLPNASVEQNDDEGIITKIRLKLFQGKIWNKVVRLASESEFNVETTSAIAGVRGTEFGIDAAGTELIVLSGEVAARKFAPGEGSAPDEYFKFDVTAFDPMTQVAVNPNQDFDKALFLIPLHNGAMPVPAAVNQNDIETKFYKPAFSNNYRPKILSLDTTVANSETLVFEYLEGVDRIIAETDAGPIQFNQGAMVIDMVNQTITINPAQLFGAGPVHFRFEDENKRLTGFSNPAISIDQNLALTEQDIHDPLGKHAGQQGCQGAPVAIDIFGPPAVVAGTNNNQFMATAVFGGNCTQDVTALCNWNNPVHGMMSANGVFSVNAMADGVEVVDCTFQAINDANPPTVKVLSEVHAQCAGNDLLDNTGDDKGHWDQPTCWVLGAANEDCNQACGSVLANQAQCDSMNNWDDNMNCTICENVIGMAPMQCNDNPAVKAPFLLGADFCRYRGAGNSDCAEAPGMNERRICSCISL